MLEFLAEYLVLLILIVEGVILAALLLPLPAFVARPLSQIIKRINVYILVVVFALVFFLLLDSWWSTRYYTTELEENRHEKHEKQSRELLMHYYRAQRNFYLNAFAFALMVIIFRVRQLVAQLSLLKLNSPPTTPASTPSINPKQD